MEKELLKSFRINKTPGALKWLTGVIGSKIKYVIYLLFLQAFYGASGVLYALLLRWIVDSATSKDADAFWKAAACTFLLLGVQILLRTVIRYLEELSRSTYENLLKQWLFDKILSMDYAKASAVHSGVWMTRLTSDTVVAANGCVEILPGITGMIVKLVSALVMITVLEPRFAAILIPAGALLIVFSWLFRRTLKRLHKDVQEADGKLRIMLQEHLNSILVIRSFNAEERALASSGERMQGHQDARMRKNRFSYFCNVGFIAVMSGMYLFGVIYCGYGIMVGTITFGTLTAITQLISQIQSPFANISGYLPRYYALIASTERIMEIEQHTEPEGEILPLDTVREAYDNELVSFGLDNVSFRYYPASEKMGDLAKDQMPLAVSDMDISIKKGEYVAFTGHSGCGKSTVLKLLMGIYRPDEGCAFIRLKDSESYDPRRWRRLFAYVPQGNQLMNGKLRDVISFARPDAANNDEELYSALETACAIDFVRELDDGLDTILGERGAGLSEGQMQRVAIARALFSQSPILLLDEATSALDANTEEELLKNIRSMTDRTVVIVTHRTAALNICDRTIDMGDKGLSL